MEPTSPSPHSFGDRLRALRLTAGLSQEELAERSGVSVRGISDLERGMRRRPQIETIRLLAAALGVSTEDLNRSVNRKRGVAPTGHDMREPAARLPTLFTSFVGRQADVEALDAMLRNDPSSSSGQAVRLLTLTGPGGVGKTRLAQAVAQQVADFFPEGVWFVDLVPVTNASLVIPTIAQTLGIRQTGTRSIHEALIDWLRQRTLLLVIDNVEHVVAAASDIAALLTTCPRLTILATSRVPLHVRAEHLYPVVPLSLPARHTSTNDSDLYDAGAVALFIQRARMAKPDFQLTDQNAPVVVEICRRLDGLPLAIELAAARLISLSLVTLLDRLTNRLRILIGGPRDAPARQQTIRDTILWSYDLLSPEEQGLLRRLSVFSGGWTLDAVEAVARTDGDLGLDTLDGLMSLVEKSLVVHREQPDSETRFDMLQTIREFAAERLDEAGEADEARNRHAAFLIAFARQAGPRILYELRDDWLRHCAVEHDNIRAALQWASSTDQSQIGLDLAGLLGAFWHDGGHFLEGRAWIERFLDSPDVTVGSRAHGLIHLAWLAYAQGDNARARQLTACARDLAERIGDSEIIGLSLVRDCRLAHDRQCTLSPTELDALRARNDEALAFNHAHNHDWLVIRAANVRGLVEFHAGDPSIAVDYFQRVEHMSRRLGSSEWESLAVGNRGMALVKIGKHTEAHHLVRSCLDGFRDGLHSPFVIPDLETFAIILAACGAVRDAVRLLAAATEHRTRIGYQVVHSPSVASTLSTARQELAPDMFDEEWRQGSALSLPEAIAYALSLPEPTSHDR